MICKSTLFAGLGGLMLTVVATYANAASGIPDPNVKLTTKQVRDGAYWIKGGISNTGFIVGDSGVIAIDAQMFPATALNAQKEIAAVTSKPVTTMILTHSDPDHVYGLPNYPAGIEIIAQDNVKTELQKTIDGLMPGVSPPPAGLKDYMPGHLVKDQEDLTIDGVRMTLIHAAPAHTDGDLVVYLPDLKVVYAGDVLTPEVGKYPGIHLEKHGSSLGWIEFAKFLLTLDADIFVPGHGDPIGKKDIQVLIDDTTSRRAEIAKLVSENKPLDEIKTILGDPKLEGNAAKFQTFVESTYQELTAK